MTSDEHDVTPVHGEAEILERVHKRGTQLRRRKRFARASAAMMIVAVLFGTGLAVAHHQTKPASKGFVNPDATASPLPTDTPADVSSTLEPDTLSISPSPTAELPPLCCVNDVVPPPATVVSPCVNSYDPACGDFYWDPAPGPNAPMTISVTASSTTVTVGETVSVTGTASDPDAHLICRKAEWGPTYIGFAVTMRAKYGRWVTPDKTPGTVTETFTHVYDTPGTYKVMFEAESGACGDWGTNPYSSQGTADVTVTVVDAPTPSPTVPGSPTPSPSDSVSPSPSP